MRKTTFFISSLFCTLIPAFSFAQTFASFTQIPIVIHSDSSTRSVLLSNLLEKNSGDLSPIIGSAIWYDQGRRLQCRSLIAFDYGNLVKKINTDGIIKAELILVPLVLNGQQVENDLSNVKISVKRVIQSWNDSTTNWLNQPQTNTADEVITKLSKKKKNDPLSINVTQMVKNMFRYGNHGFLISYSDSLQASGSSHWFASAKYEVENARPILVITYAIETGTRNYDFGNLPPLQLTARDKAELLQMYTRPEPVIITKPEVIVTTNPKGTGTIPEN